MLQRIFTTIFLFTGLLLILSSCSSLYDFRSPQNQKEIMTTENCPLFKASCKKNCAQALAQSRRLDQLEETNRILRKREGNKNDAQMSDSFNDNRFNWKKTDYIVKHRELLSKHNIAY